MKSLWLIKVTVAQPVIRNKLIVFELSEMIKNQYII
ncbi:hypothetical protein SAMN05421766_10234 [Zobellia uliginosa]|uniref:Uncharacterized protein n=1 Tax=Zobellia uliginosa TaxID=143224 RepID=A0ABY1KL69_9FLAO|nr:hypothetical protein SAMN05421766_10234 [Zobellia uliginosa]